MRRRTTWDRWGGDLLPFAVFVATSVVAVRLVVDQARRDSVDPARCGALVPLGNRCCAPGQSLHASSCVGRPTSCPSPLEATDRGCVAPPHRVTILPGILHAGAGDWEAEGRVAPHDADIEEFSIDAYEITEGDYARCVAAGRCAGVPSTGEPGRALGGITQAEAAAFCAFRDGRLPTEDEWTFVAGGGRARRYPWGDTGAVCRRGFWGLEDGPCGFGFVGPELAGVHPDGASPEGVHDLAGNVGEWVIAREGGAANYQVARGGSFASGLATELRTWRAQRLPPGTRSPEIGARCSYASNPRPAGESAVRQVGAPSTLDRAP